MSIIITTIKEQFVTKIHKSVRKTFPGLNKLLQGDPVEMIPYAKFTKGFRYILVVNDVFSEFVWVEPVKQKTEKRCYYFNEVPKYWYRKEFCNQNFRKLMEHYKIHHFSRFSNLRARVIERVNKTLQKIM